jgi:hypothetical protein
MGVEPPPLKRSNFELRRKSIRPEYKELTKVPNNHQANNVTDGLKIYGSIYEANSRNQLIV